MGSPFVDGMERGIYGFFAVWETFSRQELIGKRVGNRSGNPSGL